MRSVWLISRNVLMRRRAPLARNFLSPDECSVYASMVDCDVVGAQGDQRLRSLILRDRVGGATEEGAAVAVFILIGAEPRTAWLPPGLERDERGFILTGSRLSSTTPDEKQFAFGTSLA